MKFKELHIKGIFLIIPIPHRDTRGFFARTFCQTEFEKIGIHKPFVQINHSLSVEKGTIRGLHYQKPPFAEGKLVRCIRGAVQDVVVDIRYNSPTFLQHQSVILSAQNMQMLYIPEGCAHGFQCLKANTELVYHHTQFYTPKAEGGLRFDDPSLQIQWFLPPKNISVKDQQYALIDDTFRGVKI